MNSTTCQICNKAHKTFKGLGQHVNKTHVISSNEYGLKFFKIPKCKCGQNGKFLSITKGFDCWCSNCETQKRSESATKMRQKLLQDPEKQKLFIERLSNAVKKEWRDKDQTERIGNVSKTIRANVAKLSKEEKNKKFGWMNAEHVTKEKKFEVWKNSLGKYWDELSENEKEVIYKKRALTSSTNGKKKPPKEKISSKGKVYDNNFPPNHEINKWALGLKTPFDNLPMDLHPSDLLFTEVDLSDVPFSKISSIANSKANKIWNLFIL